MNFSYHSFSPPPAPCPFIDLVIQTLWIFFAFENNQLQLNSSSCSATTI